MIDFLFNPNISADRCSKRVFTNRDVDVNKDVVS